MLPPLDEVEAYSLRLALYILPLKDLESKIKAEGKLASKKQDFRRLEICNQVGKLRGVLDSTNRVPVAVFGHSHHSDS